MRDYGDSAFSLREHTLPFATGVMVTSRMRGLHAGKLLAARCAILEHESDGISRHFERFLLIGSVADDFLQ